MMLEIVLVDWKFYVLCDVIEMVVLIFLIIVSIFSKKLVEGFDVLVLDVKFGDGVFMNDLDLVRWFVESFVFVVWWFGVRVKVVFIDMN